MFSQSERRLLAGLTVVTAASWGRFFATESLKVDENYPSRVAGYALLAVLVLGWGLAVSGWSGLLAAPPRHPRKLTYAALAIAGLMLPMLSNDVFSLMAYGSAAAQGHDVYTTTDWLPQNAFYAFLGEHWNGTVCVYGPATLLATLPVAVAHGSPWIALYALRLVWFVPVVVAMETTFRRLADRPSFFAMVWLNPLWLVEGPGQMHADLLGLVALSLGIALHLGGKITAGIALYAGAYWSKYSSVAAGLWFVEAGAKTGRERARRIVLGAVLAAATGAVLYVPFWHGPATITTPLHALATMNPGGSITEVMGILLQGLFHGRVTAPDLPVKTALAMDRLAKERSWEIVSYAMRAVSALTVGVILKDLLRKGSDRAWVALATGAVTVSFLTLFLPRFQCWYLLAALPFFGLATTPAWRRWWIAIVAVSVPVDFNCVLERTSPVYPIWGAVTTGAQVLLFVAWFRPRYLQLGAPDAAPPGATAPGEPSSPQASS